MHAYLGRSDTLQTSGAKGSRVNKEDTGHASRLCALGCAYQDRYQDGGTKSDLEKAVAAHEEALQLIPNGHSRFSEYSAHLGAALKARFDWQGCHIDLENAIMHYRNALKVTDDGDPEKASLLNARGLCLYSQFEGLRATADLHEAIALLQRGVELTPVDHPQKPTRLYNLGIASNSLFEHLSSLADLNLVSTVLEISLEISLADRPERSELFNNMGGSSKPRFRRLGSLRAVIDTISLFQQAVELTPCDDPDRPRRLVSLGSVFQSSFEHFGRLADLDRAISFMQSGVNLVPDEPSFLHCLGSAFKLRFEQLGAVTDLDKAIGLMQKSVDLMPDIPLRLFDSGFMHCLRFKRLGSLADLNQAIVLMQNAVEVTPENNPNKHLWNSSLANALKLRFWRIGNPEDSKEAARLTRTAVELAIHPIAYTHTPAEPAPTEIVGNKSRDISLGAIFRSRFKRLGGLTILHPALSLHPESTPEEPKQLCNLATVSNLHHGYLRSLADINRAIELLRIEVELTPDGDIYKVLRLSNLGIAFQLRYECLRMLADLDCALSLMQNAVELTPDAHSAKASFLSRLANAFSLRFEHLNNPIDLSQAISHLKNAVGLTSDGDVDKPSRLKDLANALWSRFKLLGDPTDLEHSLSHKEDAASHTRDDDPSKAALLCGLAEVLDSRFKLLGKPEDLNRAIEVTKKSVELSAEGHSEQPTLPTLLNKPESAVTSGLKPFLNPTNPDASIRAIEKVTQNISDEHPNKPFRLLQLGIAMKARFDKHNNLEDLNHAISFMHDATEITPEGHPFKPLVFNRLGDALESRFGSTKIPGDLENASQAYSRAANSSSGAPRTRLEGARGWARTADRSSKSPLEAFGCAIDLLPRIAWLGLPVTDQHALLAQVGHTVRDAVAAAIQHKRLEIAVEWVEQGRSLVWQNLLGLRNPMDDLERAHPELANQLRDISQRLEASTSYGEISEEASLAPLKEVAGTYSNLAIEWDRIVEEIRKIPEFKTFLKPRDFNTLAYAATEGNIVILNVHASRCDALVLTVDNSNHRRVSAVNIPLENFSYTLSEQLLQMLNDYLSSEGLQVRSLRKSKWFKSSGSSETSLEAILRSLWTFVVKPVLNGLAYQVCHTTP